MLANTEFEYIFQDGYRDPCDDIARFEYYLLMLTSFPVGMLMLSFPFMVSLGDFKLVPIWEGILIGIFGLFALVFGICLLVYPILFFWKERKYWDLKHLTPEKAISGGFTFAIALLVFGFDLSMYGMRSGGHNSLLGGIAITGLFACLSFTTFVVTLALGLVFAYWPKIRPARKIKQARIERRYAVTPSKDEIEDFVCPEDAGCTPAVTLRLPDGKLLTCQATPWLYEHALPGSTITAKVKGRLLIEAKLHQ